MLNTEILVCIAADVFRSLTVNREFRVNLCRAMLRMVEQGSLVLNPKSAPYFAIKVGAQITLLLAYLCMTPDRRGGDNNLRYTPLPTSSLHHMSERKRARLRATYAQAKHIHELGATCLPRKPVELFGPNATTNVALWPSAMQVDLGHEYKCGETSSKLSPGEFANCINSKPDVTVRGAIAVLAALVNGLEEEWLEAPGATKHSKALMAPTMTRSYAQEGHPISAGASLSPSTSWAGFPSLPTSTRTGVTEISSPCTGRLYAQFGYSVQACDRASRAPWMSQAPTPSAPLPYGIQPVQFWKETHGAVAHNKDRLRATFERAVTVHQGGSCIYPLDHSPSSNSGLALYGIDGILNVALYPRVMLVRLDLNEEDKIKTVESIIQDPNSTVEGAIDRLNALVAGIGYDWLGMTRPCDAQSKTMVAHLSHSSVSSDWSDSSEATASSLATPLYQSFPFDARHTATKL